ncbi:hypothetical protein [Pajaroellobacter abortibovis]|uniref:Uncharacterized protein n=1 Tax=Pajaroellobacter abortibovis TaxID=1882918 RepID=A0A1L6MXZ9_9BACT|nr:hypothetical protein [Pajaroellobacter abortibovis]APS00372.1 hypothetical protein BCY86_06530 [Pajaroellobacter abortibovis]
MDAGVEEQDNQILPKGEITSSIHQTHEEASWLTTQKEIVENANDHAALLPTHVPNANQF